LPASVQSPLDDVLRVAALLPVEEGAEAVARAVADLIRAVRPTCAVGVVIPGEGASGDPLYVTAAPLVPSVASPTPQPLPSAATPRETDPSRMFPHLDDEIIVHLPAPCEGVSLHVAGPISVDGEVEARLQEALERASIVLASGLSSVRRFRSARGTATELRDLQARIIQTEKLASVGQIAAKVVHELNNPLTAIVSYADFLTKKLESCGHDAADVERLRRIGESAQRILRFSRELTAYARPADEAAEPISVREIVDRSIVFCEHVVAPLGIVVRTAIHPATPTVVGRKGQLTQVFVNLVTNACHAIQDAQRDHDGEIEITASPRDDGGVTVSVGDNGGGITPQNLVRIFDPFFTTKASGRGTGLGLSIVRSIIEDHGGRIWARSVVGAGTQFIVEFPRQSR
jgi:C4-dicarboxylate-specific signal transduction histidine kinase